MLQFSFIGQDQPAAAAANYLDHGLITEKARARSVYLRLVDTNQEALNYAINGFHISVVRGIPGGCTEPVTGPVPFADGGLRWETAVCSPLPVEAQAEARARWNAAAGMYLEAYQTVKTQGWKAAKDILSRGNTAADQAYSIEGVTPPRDPETGAAEVPAAAPKPRSYKALGVGVAIAGAAVLTGTAIFLGTRKTQSDQPEPFWPGGDF